jgi:hypothetical protein
VSKHFHCGFLCVGISITQSPSKNSLTVADTEDTEIAYFVHTSGVNTTTVNGIDVPSPFDNEQDCGPSLFEIEEHRTTDLTIIRAIGRGILRAGVMLKELDQCFRDTNTGFIVTRLEPSERNNSLYTN